MAASPTPTKHGSLPAAPRVLIARLSAVGDTVLALPVACAIKRQYPQAHIAWAVEAASQSLLAGHAAVDEVIEVPKGYLKSPRSVWQLRSDLQSRQFDVALDVQGLFKSALPCWLSGARRRIGFHQGPQQGREGSTWLNNELVRSSQAHVVDQNMELLAPLGIENAAVEFGVPEHPHEMQKIHRLLTQHSLQPGRYAAMVVSTTWISKLWDPDRWAAVVRFLARTWNLRTILTWASELDRDRAEAVAGRVPDLVVLPPRMELTALGTLLRQCRVAVGVDTGPLHLAAAVGAPTVGLYGPTPSSRVGVYGPHTMCVQKVTDVSSSGRRHSEASPEMAAIDVSDVCGAIEQLLLDPALQAPVAWAS